MAPYKPGRPTNAQSLGRSFKKDSKFEQAERILLIGQSWRLRRAEEYVVPLICCPVEKLDVGHGVSFVLD